MVIMDRRYLGSNLFNRADAHSDAVPKRVWNIDHSGETERVRELHNMLVSQKAPYSAQVAWAQRRADQGRKEKAEVWRAYNKTLDNLKQRLDKNASEERERVRQKDVTRKTTGNERKNALKADLKTRQDDYREFRKQLDEEVGRMPPLCGSAPESTLKDRPLEKRIEEGLKRINSDSKLWWKEMKNLNKELKDQITYPIRRVHSDTILERKKEAGLKDLNQKLRKYCDDLTDLYDRQDMAMHNRMEGNEDAYREHLTYMKNQNTAIHAGIQKQKDKYKTWRAGMEQRIDAQYHEKDPEALTGSRRKFQYGGYVSVKESKKRLQMSAVLDGLYDADTSKGSSMNRTMRPASSGGEQHL